MLEHTVAVRRDNHDFAQREGHALTQLIGSIDNRVPPRFLEKWIRWISAARQRSDCRIDPWSGQSSGQRELRVQKTVETIQLNLRHQLISRAECRLG